MMETIPARHAGLLEFERPLAREDPLTWFGRAARRLHTVFLSRRFASFGKGSSLNFCHIASAAARHVSFGAGVCLVKDVVLDVEPGTADAPVLIFEDCVGVQRRCVFSARN